MDQTCPECNQLWRELADATTAHIRIIGKLQLAGMCHDSSLLEQLEPIVQAAAIRRVDARTAFQDHTPTHQKHAKA